MAEATSVARGGDIRPVPESSGLRLRYAVAALVFLLGYRVFGLRRIDR
jgi:hypothetical protein